MIQRLLYRYLFDAVFLLLLALVLYGVFSGTRLAVILFIFVIARFLRSWRKRFGNRFLPHNWKPRSTT